MREAVRPGRGRALAGLLIVGLGTTIVPLDTSVNIAFPDITSDFAIPIADIQWVVIFYVLTYTSLLLAFGKLGDLFGHKRIFMTGLAVSTVAFALCAMAPTRAGRGHQLETPKCTVYLATIEPPLASVHTSQDDCCGERVVCGS